MAETTRVRVADGDVWVDGEHFTRGEELDVPTAVYERIPGSFEPVDESEGDAADESAGDTGAEPPFDPGEYSVADLEAELEDGDYSGTELDALEAAERADGSPRATALDAIDAARE